MVVGRNQQVILHQGHLVSLYSLINCINALIQNICWIPTFSRYWAWSWGYRVLRLLLKSAVEHELITGSDVNKLMCKKTHETNLIKMMRRYTEEKIFRAEVTNGLTSNNLIRNLEINVHLSQHWRIGRLHAHIPLHDARPHTPTQCTEGRCQFYFERYQKGSDSWVLLKVVMLIQRKMVMGMACPEDWKMKGEQRHELRGELWVFCWKCNVRKGFAALGKGQVMGDLAWQAKEFVHI